MSVSVQTRKTLVPTAYYNTVQETARVYDGFLLAIGGSSLAPRQGHGGEQADGRRPRGRAPRCMRVRHADSLVDVDALRVIRPWKASIPPISGVPACQPALLATRGQPLPSAGVAAGPVAAWVRLVVAAPVHARPREDLMTCPCWSP